MDRLFLSGIEFFAHGGVLDAEREVGQHYRADVELEIDLTAAVRTDSLEHTADLAELHRIVLETAQERPFILLESLTGRIADNLIQRLPVDAVTVRVQKLRPPLPGVAAEGVQITRRRGSA
jgi:dihydroneopterin aldolase